MLGSQDNNSHRRTGFTGTRSRSQRTQINLGLVIRVDKGTHEHIAIASGWVQVQLLNERHAAIDTLADPR
jgi:hypothetical protein